MSFGGSIPSGLDAFSVEVLRLRWSREPNLSASEIFCRLPPVLCGGKTLKDVKDAISRMECGFRQFQRNLGERVLITSGKHALEYGRVVGEGYNSRSVPAEFTKTNVITDRIVVDIKLINGGGLTAFPFDDIIFENEDKEACCFGDSCIGNGYLAGWDFADPIKPNEVCCKVCFVARVEPLRVSSGFTAL